MSDPNETLLLFAYGSFRKGEADHAALAGSRHVGVARTAAGYRLVDLGVYAAMIESGDRRVSGELYEVTREVRRHLDVLKEAGVLFHRTRVRLEDGRTAEAYLMREDQVRGRRRLRVEDWKLRFQPNGGGY
jgi:gamma-glutamylcyclotransferase (GGCT)/AIG2-like uncharacterized protein YtfP